MKKHIHLSGICGTAMASLAGLLQQEGHHITGSDKAAYPPMSDLLRSLGIPILETFSEANLSPTPDLVVIGNALSRGNPEVECVLDERIPFTSMAALVHDEFLAGRESLVVAGTHGKTTTTSMLAWIYQVASKKDAEREPSFLIGGVAENFSTSFQLRPTRTFIIEGDGFLYKMCRGIVGTLVQVGQGKIAAEEIGKILAGRDRRLAGMTAPACGLVLWKVHYGAKRSPG